VDSTGLVTAVWTRKVGTDYIIQSSTSQSGRAWVGPDDVSIAGVYASNPKVTVDSSGLVTAVWVRDDGNHEIIQSSTSQSGGPWSSPPANLSAIGEDASSPQVTVDSDGLATAVWQRSNGANTIIQSSTSLNGVPWSSPPANLSAIGEDASSPQVTVDSDGLATAVWQRFQGGTRFIQSSSSLEGGTWSTGVNVSLSGDNSFNSQVTVDSNGLVTAIWERSGTQKRIQSSTSLDGVTWSTPVNLFITDRNATVPQVTVDFAGLATAIWQRFDGEGYSIQSSNSLNGGLWSTPVTLSVGEGDAFSPQLALGQSSRVTAVWYYLDGSNEVIQSSRFRETTTPPNSPATTSTPTLAATGASVEWLVFAGLIAVIAGAGFLTVSRRKRTA
jgi:LPXTG-motif cell wall-anchored protein